MLCRQTDPDCGRRYSKMIIVYCVCMKLQADFVGCGSCFASIITSVLTTIEPEDQIKAQSTLDGLTLLESC